MAKGSIFSQIQCLVVVLPDGSERKLVDYLLPSAILMLAALLLMISIFLPYWRMTMTAPPRADRQGWEVGEARSRQRQQLQWRAFNVE